MARDLSTAYATAVDESTLRLAYIVLMSFDSGDVQLWSGSGNLSWNSLTWTGTGTFGGISAIEEARGVEAPGVQLSLSGIPSAMLALALTDVYQGRPVKVWQALFDASNVLIADPALVFSGYMDTMDIADAGEIGMITLSCVGANADLSRTREQRYTHAEQTRLFAGDLGLEYVASLQNKPLYWGTNTPRDSLPPQDRDAGDYWGDNRDKLP